MMGHTLFINVVGGHDISGSHPGRPIQAFRKILPAARTSPEVRVSIAAASRTAVALALASFR